MKTAFGALLLIFLLTASTISVAQTRRRGTTPRKAPPAAAKPQPEPVAQPTAPPPVATSRPPLGPVNVVELNGQTLSTADLDPAVRQQLDQVENKIDAARREILDVQINTILLQVEANKRRIDTRRLYETEVTERIPAPAAAASKNRIIANPG